MKLEAGTWRFEEVAFVQRLRLGDPQFAKATARQESQQSEYMALAAIGALVTARRIISGTAQTKSSPVRWPN